MRNRRILQDLNRDLILQTPLVPPDPVLFEMPKSVQRWTVNLHGRSVERIIIYLRSDVGCQFGVKTGGCTGCRHWRLGTAGTRVLSDGMYVKQYMHAAEEHGLPPVCCVYNEGNVLNDWELPTGQLLHMVTHMAQNGVERLVLESRTEYITDSILDSLCRAAGDNMELEIGIGLESTNEFIRNELFLKAMSLKSYERSLKRMKEHGVRSLAYVILKPAFLNEAQAVKDAVETAAYAFAVGTDAVCFEPIGVEPHTVTEVMYRAGAFKPAWLWTVLNVARQTLDRGEVRIGGFQFSPLPQHLPSNCAECDRYVLRAIDQYNLTYNPDDLEVPRCDTCYSTYEVEIAALSAEVVTAEIEYSLRSFVRSVTEATLPAGQPVLTFA